MYRIFDYACTTPDCSEEGQIVEKLVETNEFVMCHVCQGEMIRHVPNPRGYVKGSHTPVRQ